MSTSTVPISEAAHELLKELAKKSGQSMLEVLNNALEIYRRKLFFEHLDAGYAELRADQQAWPEHDQERKDWDPTLQDGLDSEDRWTTDGRALNPNEKNP